MEERAMVIQTETVQAGELKTQDRVDWSHGVVTRLIAVGRGSDVVFVKQVRDDIPGGASGRFVLRLTDKVQRVIE